MKIQKILLYVLVSLIICGKCKLKDVILYVILIYLVVAHVPGIVWASWTLLPHFKLKKNYQDLFLLLFVCLFLGEMTSFKVISNSAEIIYLHFGKSSLGHKQCPNRDGLWLNRWTLSHFRLKQFPRLHTWFTESKFLETYLQIGMLPSSPGGGWRQIPEKTLLGPCRLLFEVSQTNLGQQ